MRHIVMTCSTYLKYHQNIPNAFQVIERTRNGRTDARFIALSPKPFGRGIKSKFLNPLRIFPCGKFHDWHALYETEKSENRPYF